jgi:hypothetical protein
MDERPSWRVQWDKLSKTTSCNLPPFEVRDGELQILGERVSLDDDDIMAKYKNYRRARFVDKFGFYWQLEASIKCGAPNAPAIITEHFNLPPGAPDPAFDDFKMLIRKYQFKNDKFVRRRTSKLKYDTERKKNINRGRWLQRELECPMQFTTEERTMRSKARCATIIDQDFGPENDCASAPQVVTAGCERRCFELYRKALTVNQWLTNRQALVCSGAREYDALDDAAKKRLKDGSENKGQAKIAKELLERGAPLAVPPPPPPRLNRPPLPQI